MNFIDPLQNDHTVHYNEQSYTIGYYREPLSLSGVVDENYPEYDPATQYATGDFVIVDALKSIYRSSADLNTGQYPPANPTKWTLWSPINSYRMLATDAFIGAKTEGVGIVLEIDFSQCTGFALVDTDFDTVTIEHIVDDTVIASETKAGSGYGAVSWYDYLYSPFAIVTRVTGEREWTNSSRLRLTFTGEAKIGALIVGLIENLGCTMQGTTLSFEDKSTIKTSTVGAYREVLRYGSIRTIDAKVSMRGDLFGDTVAKVDRIIGRNILFLPTPLDKFSESILIGYFESFDIPMLSSSSTNTQATIIGV